MVLECTLHLSWISAERLPAAAAVAAAAAAAQSEP